MGNGEWEGKRLVFCWDKNHPLKVSVLIPEDIRMHTKKRLASALQLCFSKAPVSSYGHKWHGCF